MGEYVACRITVPKEYEDFLIEQLGEPEEVDDNDKFFEAYWMEANWGGQSTIDELVAKKVPFIYWCEAGPDWSESDMVFDGEVQYEVLSNNNGYVLKISLALFENSIQPGDIQLSVGEYVTGQYYLSHKQIENFRNFVSTKRKLEEMWGIGE